MPLTGRRFIVHAAAALAAAPLLFAAEDLRSGLQLGGAVAAALTLLQLALLLTRTAAAAGTSAAAGWATVAAAAAGWLLAACGLIAPELVALLPLAVANPAWWRSDAAPAVGLLLVFAPPLVGALRSAAAWLATADDGGVVAGSAAWLLSPAGLLIAAALGLALYRQLRGGADAPS
ncbi:MAG: hypothetical protein BGP24_08355 [Lysobacterales bacterium 69-70]|nr:hypothetical protein [Xanthomonadaceae bacterium]ODU34544.1 MAG: hypothetical protein ABS97_08115 [Xanthomonadaceae bacterium SCN 69-320]ODV19523.1 MAG: hypothetical protein ABT27_10810 [Xanthomonadaceae bacterium SCN 69-25]OJY94733.1 MAG: hypothetical protein BGP24_08355 [Xanthomonadales bacterium 69-70]